MNYLFFDIECCDGRHICSFGYIKTDEKFKILEKKDIIINPKKPFKLGPKGEEELKLCYDKDVFFKEKEFPFFYEKLRTLLTDPNCVNFGFSIANDFNFLNIACHRYGLPPLLISGFDVQALQKFITHDTNCRALEKVAISRHIDISKLKLHKSCDDAQLSMCILKNICKEQHFTTNDILEAFKNCLVHSKPYIPKQRKSTTTY